MSKMIKTIILLGIFMCLFSCSANEIKHLNEKVEKSENTYDKMEVEAVRQKLKIILDKELPYTYEIKNDNTNKMDYAWQLTGFNYSTKENYATKNNDLTLNFTFKLLYLSNEYYRGTYAFSKISLIDEQGNPAKIERISTLAKDWDSFFEIKVSSSKLKQEGEVVTENFTFRDIPDGQYTLVFDGDF